MTPTTVAMAVLLPVVVLAAWSIVWSTLRSGMSPMPSSRAAREAMLHAVAQTQGPVADLGSGWGHLALAIAGRQPDRTVVGYELSWLPWLTSCALARLLRRPNVRFYRGDFLRARDSGELSGFRVLMTYLHAPGMRRLQAALSRDPGSVETVISNNFAFNDWPPEAVWRLRDFYHSPVYRYSVKTLIHHKGSDCASSSVN